MKIDRFKSFIGLFIGALGILIPFISYADQLCAANIVTGSNFTFPSDSHAGGTLFTEGSNCRLDQIGMHFGSTGGIAQVYIYNNNAGAVGTQLEQCSDVQSNSSYATSTCSGTNTLVSGQSYWFVVDGTGQTNFNVTYGGSSGVAFGTFPPSGWTYQSGSSLYFSISQIDAPAPSPTTSSTSSINQTQSNLFQTFWIFFACMFFVVWLFRRP